MAEAPCKIFEEEPKQDGDGAESASPKQKQPTQSEILIQLAESGGAQLFHAPDRTPFALLPSDDHLEVWEVESKSFKLWLRHCYYVRTGKAPNAQSFDDALKTLGARALFDGEKHPVHTRVAGNGEAIYLDLCKSRWEAVEITGSGWRVVTKPPVRFRRTPGMESLPYPVPGGSIADLRSLVNLPDDDAFALFVSFLVAALRPRGPYPVLVLHGEQGSAKSTLARIARALVDPARAPLRTIPRNERDLMISATRSWVLAFDNLSGLKPWLSDALCRLASGGGFATRELYTNSDEVIFSAMRPVILNGIDEVVGRQDLIDRSIIHSLPTIPDDRRRREEELLNEFEALRPQLLGALLDAVSCALRRQSTVRLETSPRMADFAHWAVAAEPAFPWSEGTFLEAYEGNRQEAVEVSLEADPVACALRALVEEHGAVEGTCQELLNRLNAGLAEHARSSRAWPKSARSLSSRLKRAAPALRRVGIETHRTREPGSGRRLVRLVQTESVSDRHDRHDRHEAPHVGPSARDANQPPVTVDPVDRHGEDATTTGLRDGRDGCDGRDAQLPMDPQPPPPPDDEELRL